MKLSETIITLVLTKVSKPSKQDKPSKMLTLNQIIKHIPDEAIVSVLWKERMVLPEGGTKKELKSKKYLHDMEIVKFVQDEIEGHVYVDIEVM